jgi:hypothetical protein
MLTNITLRSVVEGEFNEDNDWVEGAYSDSTIYGRLLVGNKFSQFDVGVSKRVEYGGTRFSNFRSLFIKDIYKLNLKTDLIVHKGLVYNILQEADETVFGFRGFLIEAKEP